LPRIINFFAVGNQKKAWPEGAYQISRFVVTTSTKCRQIAVIEQKIPIVAIIFVKTMVYLSNAIGSVLPYAITAVYKKPVRVQL
jgi:hypothetical protein